MTAEAPLRAYLDQVAGGLHGPRRRRARILAELRDGLGEAVTDRLAEGLPPHRAVTAAIAAFGTPGKVAAAFAGETATAYARRTLAGYLATGPLVGIWWLLLLHPDWAAGPAALVTAIPVLPLVAAGLATAAGTLATTGRLMRWLPETGPRRALAATAGVASLAAAGDLLVIAIYLLSGLPAGTIAAVATTASLLRIGCGPLVLVHANVLRRAMCPG
jgi:hypothetical protein